MLVTLMVEIVTMIMVGDQGDGSHHLNLPLGEGGTRSVTDEGKALEHTRFEKTLQLIDVNPHKSLFTVL